MGSAKVKLGMRGVRDILNDYDVIEWVTDKGEAVAEAANAMAPEHGYYTEPFECAESTTSKGNTCVVVYTRTDLGKAMQAKHSTLTKALDAGRG